MAVKTFGHQATDTYVVVETASGWDGTERQRELACFRYPADAETFVRRVNARPGRVLLRVQHRDTRPAWLVPLGIPSAAVFRTGDERR